ncbi:MAG: hypothetical protein LBI69_02605 [Puniceicoccales bacterium]|jgi:cell fate (sporulation/competence/biofilm development) regulator YlbF (YheA/YmcA/DUF963 family)|nr:hypothetical protein [Puniceicoccales bacterium]
MSGDFPALRSRPQDSTDSPLPLSNGKPFFEEKVTVTDVLSAIFFSAITIIGMFVIDCIIFLFLVLAAPLIPLLGPIVFGIAFIFIFIYFGFESIKFIVSFFDFSAQKASSDIAIRIEDILKSIYSSDRQLGFRAERHNYENINREIKFTFTEINKFNTRYCKDHINNNFDAINQNTEDISKLNNNALEDSDDFDKLMESFQNLQKCFSKLSNEAEKVKSARKKQKKDPSQNSPNENDVSTAWKEAYEALSACKKIINDANRKISSPV